MKVLIYFQNKGPGQAPVEKNINKGDSPELEKMAMAIYEDGGSFVARDAHLQEVFAVVALPNGTAAYTWG